MNERRTWNPSTEGPPSREILELTAKYSFNSVLDVGCGWGRNIRKFDSCEAVHGFDSDPVAVVNARRALVENPGALIWEADVRTIALERQYDLVLCLGVLHFLTHSERKLAYQKLKSWVAPSGLLAVVMFNQKVQLPEDLRILMAEAPVDSRELTEEFSSWRTISLDSYVYDDEHDEGRIRHTHSIDRLIARAPTSGN
jgi:trans-aconitate methyltransferase